MVSATRLNVDSHSWRAAFEEDIEEVRARTPIEEVIGEFVTLRTAGVGSLKGLCPFHDERSPSFNVRPHVGRRYTTASAAVESGDVYTFLMSMDHITFVEAVERLAALGRCHPHLHRRWRPEP